MPPTMKTRSFNLRSCKKSLPENKEKSPLAKKPSPKKIKSKPRVKQVTPKSKKNHASSANSTSTPIKGNKNFSKYAKPKKPSPKRAISKPQVKQEIPNIKKEHVSLPLSAISGNFTSTPIEGNKNSEILIIPTMMNPCLRARNKHSPNFVNLRKQNKSSLKKATSIPRAKQENPKIKKEPVSVPSASIADRISRIYSLPIKRNENYKEKNVSVTPLFLTSLNKGAKSKPQAKPETAKIKKEHASIPTSFAMKGNNSSKKEDVFITPTPVMNPCLRAKQMHSSKYVALKTKKPSAKKSTSKPRVKQEKPMIKRERLRFPSTSSACSTSATSQMYTNLHPYTPPELQIPMKERNYLTLPDKSYEVNFKFTPEAARITPSMYRSALTSYKHSPAYHALKRKKFNTDFKFSKPRTKEIEIFTPDEDKSPFWTENLPKIEDKCYNPGRYEHIFRNMPHLPDASFSDSDPELEKFWEHFNEIMSERNFDLSDLSSSDSDADIEKFALKKNRKKKGKKRLPLSDTSDDSDDENSEFYISSKVKPPPED